MAADTAAKNLKDVWSLPEGPEVEDALYKVTTHKPSAETTVALSNWKEALAPFHKAGIDDQFMPPIVHVDAQGNPIGTVKEGDVVFYWDFRTDRAKPLTSAFLNIPYEGQVGGISENAPQPPKVSFCTMTHYDDRYSSCPCAHEAFNPAAPLSNTYAEFVGGKGVQQLVVAESEKWRAVTWFKDGRRNLGYKRQTDSDSYFTEQHPSLPITVKIVRSRKVAAHIQAPMMRAQEITDLLLEGVEAGTPDIFANFANSDMVGHAMTQIESFDGVVEAILELDKQLGRLVPAAVAKGYTVLITADHGNAEEMINKKGQANPAHTVNKVPLIILGLADDERKPINQSPTISDIAPTMLQLRGFDKPEGWDTDSVLTGPVNGKADRKIMRLVLDGYGIRAEKKGNAMAAAADKKGSALHMDRWMAGEDGAVSAAAEASGERCGYPPGEAGTTEFGHVLFDAGRKVRSDLLLIDYAIESKGFFSNPVLVGDCVQYAKQHGVTLHAMGILSDGKVHSSLEHVEAFLKLAAEQGLPGKQLSIHVITDGRDVPGDTSPKYFDWLQEKIAQYGVGQIDSVWGRGWGKDRDNRWKRIEAAYRSLVEGTAALHVQL
eukprot:m.237894 g.237894  ORF g.237894 m.237894 type:complete len:604 (+) comp13214_c0_seq1:2-1813(+)